MADLPKFHDAPASKPEVPKDLADVFESVAGAIYFDSYQLDSVWTSYYPLLKDVLGMSYFTSISLLNEFTILTQSFC